MSPRPAPPWSHHLLAIALVGFAALVSPTVDGFLPGASYAVYAFAIVAAAWFGGLGVGVAAAVLAAIAATYIGRAAWSGTASLTAVGALRFLLGAALAIFANALRRSRSTWPGGSNPDLAESCAGADASAPTPVAAVRAEGTRALSASDTNPQLRDATPMRRIDDPRRILDALADLVWLAAADGACEWFNKRWTEYSGHAVTDWRDAMHADDREAANAAWSQAQAQGTPVGIEARYLRRDGVERWHLVRVQPLRESVAQTPSGWYGQCTDIDDQKRTAVSLRTTQQRMSAFLSALGHELRNPLAALSASVQVMRHPRAASDMIGRALETLDRQTALLTRLVEELLDAARLMDGRIDLQRGCVALNELLREVCADLAARAARERVHLHCIVPKTKILVDADPLRIKQAVENVVLNALDACDAGNEITVDTIDGGAGEAGIRIVDSGRGLSCDELAMLFEPGKSPGRVDGLGLGLKAARRIVELHGGRLVARSEGHGCGATFELFLPVYATHAASGAAEAGMTHDVLLLGQRILIIASAEDAEALVAPLEYHGAQVRCAASGFEGIRLASSWAATAVLCELELPSPLSGYDVARQIAEKPDQRPRLIAIGNADRIDAAVATAAGFDACLVRPVAPQRLLAALVQAATFAAVLIAA
ncbi:MAG: ATP-binding protein [Lysobacterales bacterium]